MFGFPTGVTDVEHGKPEFSNTLMDVCVSVLCNFILICTDPLTLIVYLLLINILVLTLCV